MMSNDQHHPDKSEGLKAKFKRHLDVMFSEDPLLTLERFRLLALKTGFA